MTKKLLLEEKTVSQHDLNIGQRLSRSHTPPPIRIARRQMPHDASSDGSSISHSPSEPSIQSTSSPSGGEDLSLDDRPLEHPGDSFLETTVHGYYFQRLISCGGSAKVYRVVKDDKTYVAKVSLDNSLNPNFVHWTFATEFRLLKSVSHKNIIRAYEHFEHHGRQVIIMEYFNSCNLQQYIARTSLGTRRRHLKSISKQILKAIKYLHKNGIVHRDIKPANILIGRNYKVKIVDFGGAIKLHPAQMVEDRRPTYLTHDFAPPEVHARDVRSACDVWMAAFDMWSLGVTLYESLTGKTPYTVESDLSIKRESFFLEPDYGVFEREDTKLLSLVKKCLDIQPATRITAKEAMKTRYCTRFF